MKTHITILVEGGVVQSVHSSDPNVEVELFDLDDDDKDNEQKEEDYDIRKDSVTPYSVY